jgi:uncharacterized protein YjbJ (UPF0337 family)
MASNLPSTEVVTLQAEVAEARTRLASHLEKLTAPETFAAAKNDVMQQVDGYKQQLLGGARESGEGFVDGMKRRVSANPIPVAMIGAGLLWRFYRHPPVATLLVGAGAAMLMRAKTPADPNAYRDPYRDVNPGPYVPGGVAGYGYPVEASAPGSSAIERVGAAASDLGDRARDAGEKARHMAADAGAAVSDMASRAVGAASDAADRARTTAADLAGRATSAASDAAGWAQETASDVTERAGSMISGARDQAGSMVEGARDRAGSMVSGLTGSGSSSGSPVPQQPRWAPHGTSSSTSSTLGNVGDSMRHGAASIADMAQRNTVALGVIGIVAGALLGRSLRSSRAAERFASTAGDTWDRGSRRVGSRMRGATDYARQRAERLREDGGDAARGTWDAAGNAASSATSAVSEAASGAATRAADLASGVADAASRVAETTGEALSSVTSGVSRATSSAYRTASRQAAYAGRRAASMTEGLPGEVANLAQAYPLLFGTVGLALGAALGGSMRLSESEKRVMAPASEALKERARELAEQQLGNVTEMAERLGESLQARVAGSAERTDDSDGVPVGDSDPAVVVGGRPRPPGETGEPTSKPPAAGMA